MISPCTLTPMIPLGTSPNFGDATSKLAELDPLITLLSFNTATVSCFLCCSPEAHCLQTSFSLTVQSHMDSAFSFEVWTMYMVCR